MEKDYYNIRLIKQSILLKGFLVCKTSKIFAIFLNRYSSLKTDPHRTVKRFNSASPMHCTLSLSFVFFYRRLILHFMLQKFIYFYRSKTYQQKFLHLLYLVLFQITIKNHDESFYFLQYFACQKEKIKITNQF